MKIQDLIASSDPTRKIKELQKFIDKQAQMIERLRKPRVKLPTGKAKGKASSKTFLRVIFGDSHGAYADVNALSAFVSDMEVLQPAELVHVGDALDCGGFLSSHNVLGVVPELAVTFEQDVLCANSFLDSLQSKVPHAKITLMEGNHENRIARWVCKQVLSNHANASYLLKMFGPEAVLNTAARGIRYIRRDEYYDGLSISGTIKLEPFAIAQHGEAYCGQQAAARQLQRLGKTVFFGHTHRLIALYGENLDGTIAAFNTGCLCQTRPLYGLTKTTDWTQGYVLEAVDPKDGFLAIPVPIINGVSYLQPLIKILGIA